jgi:hypothetical protein
MPERRCSHRPPPLHGAMRSFLFPTLLLAVFALEAPLSDGGAAANRASRAVESFVLLGTSPGGVIVEGQLAEIGCLLFGQQAKSCAVIAEGELTPLGGKSRGRFTEVISQPAPIQDALEWAGVTLARFAWTPGWLDARTITLKVKFFSGDGSLVGMATREIEFTPECLGGCDGDCVVISKAHQRLYAVKDGRLDAVYLVSTGTRHRDGGGPTPAMATQIIRKTPYAYSRRYHSPMHYWNAITSDGAYGIHATVPSNYGFLGRPASHGCIRLHEADAMDFYQACSVGTPVVVSDL